MPVRLRLAYVMILIHVVLVSSACGAMAADDKYEIPFSFLPPSQPLITIKCIVGNSRPLVFMVDTGSQVAMILSTWAAKEAGIKPKAGEVNVIGSGVKLAPTGGFTIQIQGSSLSNTLPLNVESAYIGDFEYVKEYPGPTVAGIIGGDLFKAVSATFDFSKSILTLKPPTGKVEPAPSNSVTLPVTNSEDGILPRVTLHAPGGGGDISFIVDTGRGFTSIPKSAFARLKFSATGATVTATPAGRETMKTGLLASLGIGPSSLPLVEVGELPVDPNAWLGLDVISRFQMTLDGPNNRVIFVPREPNAAPLSGGYVVELNGGNGNFQIGKILMPEVAGGGLREGDKLISIDGHPVKSMNFTEAVIRLNGLAGTAAKLEVMRDSQRVDCTWMRPSHYEDVIVFPMGVIAMRDDKLQLKVIHVSSAAANQGVANGDAVMLVNEFPTQNRTSRQVRGAITEAHGLQSITIKRQSDGKEVKLK